MIKLIKSKNNIFLIHYNEVHLFITKRADRSKFLVINIQGQRKAQINEIKIYLKLKSLNRLLPTQITCWAFSMESK